MSKSDDEGARRRAGRQGPATPDELTPDELTPDAGPLAAQTPGSVGPAWYGLGDDLEADRARAALLGRMLGLPPEPVRVGRYRVIERLGQGGMGVVYAAHDDELDRRVALKVVRSGRTGPSVRARIRGEAMAMAKLSHPNVVVVYEVGTHDGELFIAMELVEGVTLRQWQGEASRDWSALVDGYLQAARGLAAAHDAGFVHRDFKPDNALVGHDDRVRVVDFGLAVAEAEASASRCVSQAEDDPERAVRTNDGALVGTPAYMAPEQFSGGGTSPRTDQFAWCVSLWEALHGQRPFRGGSIAELAVAVETAPAVPSLDSTTSTTPAVPRWLTTLLLRGLSAEPAARWPTMHTLVEACEAELSGRRTRRRRTVLAGGALVLVVAASVAGWRIGGHVGVEEPGQGIQPCQSGAEEVATAWGPEQRGALQRRLDAAPDWVVPVGTRSMERLDGYAEGWAQVRDASCLRHEHGLLSDPAFDRRMQCLDRRHVELDAVAQLLPTVDDRALARAAKILRNLEPLDRCQDDEQLQARAEADPPPDDPRLAADVARAYEQLVRIRVEVSAGQLVEALRKLEALGEQPPVQQDASLGARVAHLRGAVLSRMGRFDEALPLLEQALWTAEARGLDDLAAGSAKERVMLWINSGKHDQVLEWLEHARALGERAGGKHWVAFQKLEAGVTFRVQQRYDLARERFLALIDHFEVTPGINDELPLQYYNLSEVMLRRYEYEEALVLAERGLELAELELGPEHPQIAILSMQTGICAQELGRLAYAEDLLSRAQRITEKTRGLRAPLLMAVLNVRATGLRRLGRLDQAKALGYQGLELAMSLFDREHENVKVMHSELGRTALVSNDPQGAREHFGQALAIVRAGGDDEDPRLLPILYGLAQAEQQLGAREEDERLTDRAYALTEQHEDLDPGLVAAVVAERGRQRLNRRRYADARAYLERALRLQQDNLVPRIGLSRELAQTRFWLAQALWRDGRAGPEGRRAAREHAQQAYEELWLNRHPIPQRDDLFDEVEAWVREHPQRGSTAP